MNNLFVVLLGVGTVFVGLVCIIILCKIISLCCNANNKKADNSVANAPASATQSAAPITKKAEIPNRRETVAAIAAAIAEDLGEDISAIRILSIEQM